MFSAKSTVDPSAPEDTLPESFDRLLPEAIGGKPFLGRSQSSVAGLIPTSLSPPDLRGLEEAESCGFFDELHRDGQRGSRTIAPILNHDTDRELGEFEGEVTCEP